MREIYISLGAGCLGASVLGCSTSRREIEIVNISGVWDSITAHRSTDGMRLTDGEVSWPACLDQTTLASKPPDDVTSVLLL